MPGRLRALGLGLAAIVGPISSTAASVPHAQEQALRYYAAHGQTARVAAEARRLSRLDPTWRLPADIDATKPMPEDEAPLWDLYRQGRLDDVTRAIAERQAAEPTWRPSAELVARMKASRLRAAIFELARQGRWTEVVQATKAAGTDWASDDAQALWIIAEARAREHDPAGAYDIYRSLLATHDDRKERTATIEFAIPLIPMALTEKLIAMGRKDASGASEFAAIATDVTRARISAFLHDEPADEPSGSELAAFLDFARAAKAPDEAGLVAWYAYKRHDDATALDWFKIAIARGGDAMIAHGLAHTLRRLDRRREAEEVAYAWRGPLVNNAILFIDLLETDLTREHPALIEPARLARYAGVTLATESGEGAQALAWYAYNTCAYATALQWFERATAWAPKEATVYGYALALQRTHRTKEFREIVNRYDGLFSTVAALAFDEAIAKPRPSCELHRTELRTAVDWTGRTLADTDRSAASPPPPVEFGGAIPTPGAMEMARPRGRLKKRTAFPVAVDPENPLRFRADGALPDSAAVLHDARRPTLGSGLVARRVPGVGAMPYERFGVTLLPGYNGVREASSPTASERAAPRGTLWALEQSPGRPANAAPASGTGSPDRSERKP